MIEFGPLRAFVAVADELHFGRAAKRLHMTQPPLSRQIQLLEQNLGVRLLERTSRCVALTPAGRVFLAEARALLQGRENAVRATRLAAGAAGGALAIGLTGTTTYGYLPWLTRRLRDELPHVEIAFHEMTSAEQLDALGSGDIDLGLVRPVAVSEPVRSACVQREDVAVALPRDHPLASRRLIDPALLEGQPLITYAGAGRYMDALVTQLFESAGVRPRIVQAMSQAQAVLSLVSTGMGLAIVPSETRNACFESVVFRPLDLPRPVFVELHAIWRGDNRNPALPRLLDLVFRT